MAIRPTFGRGLAANYNFHPGPWGGYGQVKPMSPRRGSGVRPPVSNSPPVTPVAVYNNPFAPVNAYAWADLVNDQYWINGSFVSVGSFFSSDSTNWGAWSSGQGLGGITTGQGLGTSYDGVTGASNPILHPSITAAIVGSEFNIYLDVRLIGTTPFANYSEVVVRANPTAEGFDGNPTSVWTTMYAANETGVAGSISSQAITNDVWPTGAEDFGATSGEVITPTPNNLGVWDTQLKTYHLQSAIAGASQVSMRMIGPDYGPALATGTAETPFFDEIAFYVTDLSSTTYIRAITIVSGAAGIVV